MAGGPPLTGDQVLSELDLLARVEHALCVEYLSIMCALGPGPSAGAAFALAKREMRHLHEVNQALAAAGRPHQLGRASSIPGSSGAELALGPLRPEQLEGFRAHEREIASVVDERYARIQAALESAEPPFDPELVQRLTFILESDSRHAELLFDPVDRLPRPAPPPDVPRSDELERSLLELSDRQYGLVLAHVAVWFAHEDQPDPRLGGELPGRGQALAAMDALDAILALLVARGLTPPFTVPAGV